MYIYMSHLYINVYNNMYINKIKKLRKEEPISLASQNISYYYQKKDTYSNLKPESSSLCF